MTDQHPTHDARKLTGNGRFAKVCHFHIRNIFMWVSTAGRIISTAICMPFLRHPEDMKIFRIPSVPKGYFLDGGGFFVAIHRQVLNTILLRSQIPRCHDRKKDGLFGKAEVALVDIYIYILCAIGS